MHHPLKTVIKEQRRMTIKGIATDLDYAYITFTQQLNGKAPISDERIIEVSHYLQISPEPYLKHTALRK